MKIWMKSTTLVKGTVTKIEILSEKVDFHTELFQRQNQPDIPAGPRITTEATITIDDLKIFNEKLMEEQYFNDMCKSLFIIGGKDVQETVRRILEKLISHKLSLKINWSGRNGKFSFKTMEGVSELIMVSARRNPLCAQATEFEVISIIKSWFRSAGDREGGREKRRKGREDANKDN